MMINPWCSLVMAVSMWLNGTAVQYDPLEVGMLDRVLMTELSGTVGMGPLYVRGAVYTTMFPETDVSYYPSDSTYILGAGFLFGRINTLDIGIEHECWHPMVPFQWVPGRSQVIPNYEGGGTRVYARLTFNGGHR